MSIEAAFRNTVRTPPAGRPSGRTLLQRPPANPARHRLPRPARPPGIVLGLRGFRPDVQGLRAVAVLLVVAYHATVPGFTGGYVGVDVFFVISGFLITGRLWRELQERGRIDLGAFWVGRIRRLLPPAALVLLVTLAVARLWGSVFQLEDIAWTAILTAGYVVNYGFAATGVDYQRVGGPESPLLHFWSLAVEEQFYLAWPLLLLASAVLGRRHRRLAVGGMVTVVCATSLYLSVAVTASHAPLAYFALHTRAWELGLGAALALVARRLVAMPGWVAAPLSWLGLVAIGVAASAFSDDTPFPGSAALVPVLGAVAVIAAGCRPSRGSCEVLLRRRPMQGIGLVSYSWYLWHWPVVVLVPLLYGRRFQWWESAQLMVLALWLAIVTYWLLETPARYSRHSRLVWIRTGLSLTTAVYLAACVVLFTIPSLAGTGGPARPVHLERADGAAVQAAVAAGTSLTTAPRNLTPPLDSVGDDQPATTANGCHLGFLQVDQGECAYGDPDGERTAVLLGDSHAQQWFPGLERAATQEGWRLVAWTKAACPIADFEVHSSELQRPYTECTDWRDRVVERIVDLGPDLVVVSQSDSVPGTEIGNLQWAEDTVATLRRLQAASVPVVYVLDTPNPGIDVPECLADNLDDVGACTVPRETGWPYEGRHETLATTLAAADIATVEPIEMFCTRTDCPAVVGGLLVYRDDSHVSTAYSAWLAPLLVPLFDG